MDTTPYQYNLWSVMNAMKRVLANEKISKCQPNYQRRLSRLRTYIVVTQYNIF